MPTQAQILSLVARYFESWPDMTDLYQNIEDSLRDDLIELALGDAEQADLVSAVCLKVGQTYIELAVKTQAKAADQIRERATQEARVQAVLEQFPLMYDKLDINISELTDALFGAVS